MDTNLWADFDKGVSAAVNMIIDETADLKPSFEGLGLHKKVQADSLVYRTEGVTGFGYDEIFNEGDGLKYDQTYPAYKTEYVIKQRGKGVTVTQLLMNTRPAELEAKLDEVRQLRIATNRTMNRWFWQILNDGFVATDSNANFPIARLSDGVALFSAAHTSRVPGVANRSNLIVDGVTTNPQLSVSSLNAAMVLLKQQLNGRGLPINYEGRFVLMVPGDLEKEAIEITKSELVADSSDNAVNVYRGMVDVIATSYLDANNGGSATQWFLAAKDAPNAVSLHYVSLVDPKIETEKDFNTKSMKISVDNAGAMGYSNFEYIVGSNGTES